MAIAKVKHRIGDGYTLVYRAQSLKRRPKRVDVIVSEGYEFLPTSATLPAGRWFYIQYGVQVPTWTRYRCDWRRLAVAKASEGK